MRSHFIAGWGSWKSRRIPRFLSKARSGWSYCCRLAPAVLTAAGLSAAAGDGGAAFFAGGVTAGVAIGVAFDPQAIVMLAEHGGDAVEGRDRGGLHLG